MGFRPQQGPLDNPGGVVAFNCGCRKTANLIPFRSWFDALPTWTCPEGCGLTLSHAELTEAIASARKGYQEKLKAKAVSS